MMTITHPDLVGRIGLTENDYGVVVTVFVCHSCGFVFTVTGEHTNEEWGTGCLDETCDTYDVTRDVDLMFGVEPWRITKEGETQ